VIGMELQVSPQSVRHMLDILPEPVAVYVDGAVVYANPHCVEALRAPDAGALVGLTVAALIHADDLADVAARLERTMATGRENPPVRRRLRRMDGTYMQAETVSVRLEFEGRAGVMIMARDVAARVAAEQALMESEARYRQLVEQTHELVAVHQDGRIVYVSASTAGLLGYERADQLVGRQALEILHPEFHAQVKERIRRNLEDFGSNPLQVQTLIRSDGSEISVEVASVGIMFGGRPAVMIAGRDITERRTAELALRESEERFRSVVASASDAIVLADGTGRIIFGNAALHELFGWEPGTLLLQPLDVLMPEEVRPAHRRGLQRMLSADGPRLLGRPIETVGQRRDGTQIPIEISPGTWRSEAGRFFSGSIRDISSRRELERMKDEFLSTISHELRSPLNMISSALDLLGKDALPADRRVRALEIASNNTLRLGRLVSDLLDAQSVGRGTLRIVTRPTDIAALVRQAVEEMQPAVEAAGMRLEVRSEPATLALDGDRILQVLTNLIDNAVKFSAPGSVILVEQSRHDQGVACRVRDPGRGIPADVLPRIFERFVQVQPGDQLLGGAGLGLAICQAIVAQHGGQIMAESTAGEGSTFTFTLPGAPA
jgi:PAS domain S-box-containing protein